MVTRRALLSSLAPAFLPLMGNTAAALSGSVDAPSPSGGDDTPVLQALVDDGAKQISLGEGPYEINRLKVQDRHGLILQGVGPATVLKGPDSDSPTILDIFSNTGSGGVSEIHVRDLQISYGPYSTNTTGLRVWNCLHFSLSNVLVYSNGRAVSIHGSGFGDIRNLQAFLGQSPTADGGAIEIANGGGMLTSAGPIKISASQFGGGGPNGTPAVRIGGPGVGGAFGVNFESCQFQAAGTGLRSTIEIDGSYTDVEFRNCHGESNLSTDLGGADFRIGQTSTVDRVAIVGGTWHGFGDGVSYQRYGVRAIRCKSLLVEGAGFYRLGNAHGYDGGCVHLEPTFTGAYRVALNTQDYVGPLQT